MRSKYFCFDVPVLDQPGRECGIEAGEVEFCDGIRAALVRTQVAAAVGPVLAVAGAQEQDRALRQCAVRLFPLLDIGDADQVVRIVGRPR
jgi:hypothetical protein